MKQSINSYDFHRAFEQLRPDNFSYEGLNALFDYLEQYEEDCDTEIELDVIAICCDYSEMSYMDVVDQYMDESDIIEAFWVDNFSDIGQTELNEHILEWLQERTQVINVNDDTVIIQAF